VAKSLTDKSIKDQNWRLKMDKNEWISKFDSLILNPSTREIYGQNEFFNVGYWQSDTQNQEESCFNLMEKLLEFIPEKQGNILDVGSGLGATTSYLLNYYSSAAIVGINISPTQIERSILNAPDCKFLLMDAVNIEFEDNFFDNIICVESAFYFNTREKFLKEAWRVLKPGGNLVLSDMSFATTEYLGDWTVPQANTVKDIAEYQNIYQQLGFQQLQFVEATEECWFRHFRHLKSWLGEEFQSEKMDEETYNANVNAIDRLLSSSAITYLLVAAKKPFGVSQVK
jgi:ubiquinone/menaquinone biosynthesis C-methylase UbiE